MRKTLGLIAAIALIACSACTPTKNNFTIKLWYQLSDALKGYSVDWVAYESLISSSASTTTTL